MQFKFEVESQSSLKKWILSTNLGLLLSAVLENMQLAAQRAFLCE